MKGSVDQELRALLEVTVSATPEGEPTTLLVWVDTAFNGGLVLPSSEVQRLGLQQASSTAAVLADGQQVQLATYTCYLDWFGQQYRTQVVAGEGSHPLLGTQLLDGRHLQIDYSRRTVSLQ